MVLVAACCLAAVVALVVVALVDLRHRAGRPTRVCAWCRRVAFRGDPAVPPTHGICRRCLERETRDLGRGRPPVRWP